jgi:hypothetical protein
MPDPVDQHQRLALADPAVDDVVHDPERSPGSYGPLILAVTLKRIRSRRYS